MICSSLNRFRFMCFPPSSSSQRWKIPVRNGPVSGGKVIKASEPDRIWLADVSDVPTDEGWLSLAAARDMATMEIVGWSMSERLKMSRKGDCLDNAPMEGFFGSLKNELVHRTRFRPRRDAKAVLFEDIAIFYNRKRRHSSIGDRMPEQARIDMAAAMAA
ncbi:integrase core domain-containing protein [Rhodovulum sulfidophilum]|uniref:integrase core domain-containing protein n=1 Tax=Rhodovulum sulfidophilum TaxID=35806 RepID=UPI0019241B46|nr:integrase core domain-containing protein [Rhodovulum sulfidophilum]MBL3560409.1 transposase [Rhodovulum sulfidophilum]